MMTAGNEQPDASRDAGQTDRGMLRRYRRGLALIIAGLFVQLGCSFYWSPGAFILAASLGMPLVLLGTIVTSRAVRNQGRKAGGP